MANRIVARIIICILAFSSVLSCARQKKDLPYNVVRRENDRIGRGGKNMSTNTGENIKTLRKFYGETQEELASSMNVSGVAISYFENEQRSPDIEMTKNIAQHYGVTMDQLVGSNFSAYKNIGTFPEMNLDLDILFKAAYPFTGADTDNRSFNSGCQAAGKIVKSINSNVPVMESMIDHAMTQFEKAMDETGMPEATVNYLLMLVLKWDSLRSEEKKSLEKEAISTDMLRVDREFMKTNYLGRGRSMSREESDRKAEFVEKYGEIIIDKTRELKEDPDWSDFVDYYQALRYLADMVNTGVNTQEYNMTVGVEQMIGLVLLGNKYAVELIRQPLENAIEK